MNITPPSTTKRTSKRTCNYQKRPATLDTHHQDKLADISNANAELQVIEKDILALREYNEEHPSTLVSAQIRSLEDKRDVLAENADEVDYYTRVADVLFKYYDTFANNTTTTAKPPERKQVKSVLDFFARYESTPNKHTDESKTASNKETSDDDHATDATPDPVCRAELLDNYLSHTDKNYIKNHVVQVPITHCPYCNINNRQIFISEGLVHCESCNTVEHIITDNDKPSYKDPPKEISYFAYARINHFVEWLNNIQGKETTNISDAVFDAILLELKKYRCTNLSEVTKKQVKDILKKLKLNKYYEHTPYIWHRITGQPNPMFSPDLEETLKNMFKELQVPYLKFSPPKRKNFLSYSYTLNKLLGILGEFKLMRNFPLLKSRDKLHQQEQIWKKICEELKWEFIRSI